MVAISTPPITRGRAGSKPSAAASSATSDGMDARMSALFDAVVRSRPVMNASW